MGVLVLVPAPDRPRQARGEPTRAYSLTSAEAGRVAWRVRKLHRRGDLTHADMAVADASDMGRTGPRGRPQRRSVIPAMQTGSRRQKHRSGGPAASGGPGRDPAHQTPGSDWVGIQAGYQSLRAVLARNRVRRSARYSKRTDSYLRADARKGSERGSGRAAEGAGSDEPAVEQGSGLKRQLLLFDLSGAGRIYRDAFVPTTPVGRGAEGRSRTPKVPRYGFR